MNDTTDNYGFSFSDDKLWYSIDEENDILIYFIDKLKVGDKLPFSFLLFSPSFYTSYRIKQQPNQLILLFCVPSCCFFGSPEHIYSEVKNSVSAIRQKYKEKVLCYFLMVDNGRLRNNNDERLSTYYSYFAEHYDCIFTMSRKYDLIMINDIDRPKYVLIDQNRVIRDIQSIKNFPGFLSDYRELFPIIDNLLENKPIIGKFNREEVHILNNKLEKFIDYFKEIDKNNAFHNTFQITYNITPFKNKDIPNIDYSFYLKVFLDGIVMKKDKALMDTITEKFKKEFQEDINKGVKVTSFLNVMNEHIDFEIPHQCYKCKMKLHKSDFSYLCVKCTLAGKPKQYCYHCVDLFQSFHKFLPLMYRQFNEIDEFNKYIHNKEDDGKKCNLYHLLIFLPPNSEDYLINSSPYFSTYLENSYYIPDCNQYPNCLCNFCNIFTQREYFDETFLDDIDLYDKEIQCKNCGNIIELSSIPNSPPKWEKYFNHIRTLDAYGPLFYCLICNKYMDWVCFTTFHQIILNDQQTFRVQYLTLQNDIEYNDKEFEVDEKDKTFHSKNVFYPYDSYSYYNIEYGIGMKQEDIEKRQKCIDQQEVNGHKTCHPYLVISAKLIEVAHNDKISYSFFPTCNNIKL